MSALQHRLLHCTNKIPAAWSCVSANKSKNNENNSLPKETKTMMTYTDFSAFGQDSIDSIVKAKPAAAKGKYLRSVTLSSTMGPGVRIDTTHIDVVVKH